LATTAVTKKRSAGQLRERLIRCSLKIIGGIRAVTLSKLRNGSYHVNLYFVEANPQAEVPGGRVFNVSLQGVRTFTNLDVFAEAGANTTLIKTSNVNVTNATISIGFTPVSGLSPKISAIEIIPGNTQPTLTLNFKYPDGTPVSGNLNYASRPHC
jgi:hypothetical protein